MRAVPLRFLHHTNYFAREGGLQSILRRHAEHEGSSSRVLAFRDPVGSGNHLALGCGPRTLIREVRARYRDAVAPLRPLASIHHNFWGQEIIAAHDPARWHIGFIHSDFPHFERLLHHHAPLCDLLINIQPHLHERCRRLLPNWSADRFVTVPVPVTWPGNLREIESTPREQPVAGYIGRIVRAQKRLDRLPEFLALSRNRVPALRFELLGHGAYEERLRRDVVGMPVDFLGWRHGREYWETLRRWKYVVFFSDYEGLPLALIEAIGAGCIPIYPAFHGPEDGLISLLDPDLLYTPGDPHAAAQALARAEAKGEAWRRQIADRAQALVRGHTVEAYHHTFDRIEERLHATEEARRWRCGHDDRHRQPSWGTLTFHNWRLKRLRFGAWGFLHHT